MLSVLPQKNRQDLWTPWRISEEKGKRLRYNPVHEIKKYSGWEVRDTKQSLPIALFCLGKRAERNQFYYPMTHLSQGKYRDTSDMDHYQWNCIAPTTVCSQHIPETHNSASQRPANEWIPGKIICCSCSYMQSCSTPQVPNPCCLAWKERWSLALLSGKNFASEASSIPRSPEETLSKTPSEPAACCFCHDFSALEGLSLPTLQTMGGEGGGYKVVNEWTRWTHQPLKAVASIC